MSGEVSGEVISNLRSYIFFQKREPGKDLGEDIPDKEDNTWEASSKVGLQFFSSVEVRA